MKKQKIKPINFSVKGVGKTKKEKIDSLVLAEFYLAMFGLMPIEPEKNFNAWFIDICSLDSTVYLVAYADGHYKHQNHGGLFSKIYLTADKNGKFLNRIIK